MKNVWVLFLFILAFSCNKEKALNPSFEKIKLSDKEILKEINDCKLFEIDKEKEINDEVSAISVAEPILFSSYGKENWKSSKLLGNLWKSSKTTYWWCF